VCAVLRLLFGLARAAYRSFSPCVWYTFPIMSSTSTSNNGSSTSISRLRHALIKSLEPATSFTPTKNKKLATNCGYCYFARNSWQIRFKPYGVAISVGVLGGNITAPPIQSPSQWLGRLDCSGEGHRDRDQSGDPPEHVVTTALTILKRAELRNILQLARNQVEELRKHFQKLVVKL
jgi:hypothetical protein